MKGGEIMKNFKGILFTLVSVICLLLPTAVHAETQGAITNAEPEAHRLHWHRHGK